MDIVDEVLRKIKGHLHLPEYPHATAGPKHYGHYKESRPFLYSLIVINVPHLTLRIAGFYDQTSEIPSLILFSSLCDPLCL